MGVIVCTVARGPFCGWYEYRSKKSPLPVFQYRLLIMDHRIGNGGCDVVLHRAGRRKKPGVTGKTGERLYRIIVQFLPTSFVPRNRGPPQPRFTERGVHSGMHWDRTLSTIVAFPRLRLSAY